MRVVLDTNVLVSGTFWNGDSAEIIERIDKGELELIISKELMKQRRIFISQSKGAWDSRYSRREILPVIMDLVSGQFFLIKRAK